MSGALLSVRSTASKYARIGSSCMVSPLRTYSGLADAMSSSFRSAAKRCGNSSSRRFTRLSSLSLVKGSIGRANDQMVCGHGACGACAVHLDGEPVSSCLLPVSAIPGGSLEIPGLDPAPVGNAVSPAPTLVFVLARNVPELDTATPVVFFALYCLANLIHLKTLTHRFWKHIPG
jgi:hypothetical protein